MQKPFTINSYSREHSLSNKISTNYWSHNTISKCQYYGYIPFKIHLFCILTKYNFNEQKFGYLDHFKAFGLELEPEFD